MAEQSSPTYYTTVEDDRLTYHCLPCQAAGQEHHSTDQALFEQHMHQRHDGRMQEGDASAKKPDEEHPEHPHGGPPGQTGEHPQGGPPGQSDEHPENEPPPQPAHPIVLPEGEESPPAVA